MPNCGDCGAAVSDKAALVTHAKAAHDGMGRVQLSEGRKVRIFGQDGKLEYEYVSLGERGRELKLKEV